MRPPTRRGPTGVIAFASLLLAACRGGNGDGNGDDIVGPDVPGDPEAGQFAAMALSGELDGVLSYLILPGGPPGCVTIDPTPWVDADQDHVPDDVQFTFDLDGCRYTWDEPGSWGSTSGGLRVTDPGAAFGFDVVYQALTAWAHLSEHDPPWTISRERSGTAHVSGSDAQVTFSLDLTMVFRVTGEPDAVLTQQWSGTFDPEGPGPFDIGGLTPGTLTLTGTSTFSRGNAAIQLSLSTPTPLRWEASCPSLWPQSGIVRAHVSSGAAPGYLEITYSGCWVTGETDFIPS